MQQELKEEEDMLVECKEEQDILVECKEEPEQEAKWI